jgi:hypothetical protein
MDQQKYTKLFDRCVRELLLPGQRLFTNRYGYEVIIFKLPEDKSSLFRLAVKESSRDRFKTCFDFSSPAKLMLELATTWAFLYAKNAETNEIIHYERYSEFLSSFTAVKD